MDNGLLKVYRQNYITVENLLIQKCEFLMHGRMLVGKNNEAVRDDARCHGADVIDDESGSETTATSFCSRPAAIFSPIAR